MNRKGFSLIELMACLALLGIVLCIGLYVTRGTLSTALSTITGVTVNEIYDAAELYVVENSTKWINDGEEYTCLTVNDLVDSGYFDDEEINKNSKGWKAARLSKVSRSILRLCIYEMLYEKEIPLRVSINEGIELAKLYEDEKARPFINGVLNAVKNSLGEDAE